MKSTERTGRTRQKSRTRRALLEAAVRIVERGGQPRLASVAAEAGVSRATAYRYFPSERALLLEAPLARDFASVDGVLAGLAHASVEARVVAVHRYVYDHAVAHESQFRVFLGAIHEQAVAQPGHVGPLRAGRRLRMFEAALAPARRRLGTRGVARLRDALVALTGVEALIAMRDVCGLDARRGRQVTEWAVRSLVTAALGRPRSVRRALPPRTARGRHERA